MKKPKATVRSLREELKNLQARQEVFHNNVRAYVLQVNNQSGRRPLMSIEPVTSKGTINGITISELIMLVKLADGTRETVSLETTQQAGVDCLYVVAKKKAPRVPMELL